LEIPFDQLWEENKDYVLRNLLALARDVDLAEDCLQDTYLRAREGYSGFRGGSIRAWLVTIARNVFFTYARRKSFGGEESLDSIEEMADTSQQLGSDDYLDLLAIRGAVQTLDPALRKALLMKYYGRSDYEEIAGHLACTPAVARQRVWRAVQKLRLALSADADGVLGCSQLWGARMLDWAHGVLPDREAACIESHVSLCHACKASLTEMRKLVTILDKAESDHRILTLIDLDETGSTTRYVWVRLINDTAEVETTWRWGLRPGWTIEYLALQGEPVEIHWQERFNEEYSIIGEPDGRFARFQGDLPTPVPPGGVSDAMFVVHPTPNSHWEAGRLSNNMWHYHHKHTPFPNQEGVFIVTIRLPKGARLVEVDPEPRTRTVQSGRTSLTWQIITDSAIPAPDRWGWQFQADLEYVLKT
jgi:RNA polymerase sigma-70 factor, ECF subfamily